jgi:UDP-N-acetylmuramoylalanine--D-glutamate ligase
MKNPVVDGKKALLVGVGILGGGLSMAKYLLENGADLTITDQRSQEDLKDTISKLSNNIKYTLGEHRESDFETADVIIFNPAVSYFSEWVQLAQKLNKEFYNDYSFFLESIRTKEPKPIVIGVTGTRGKTTISTWIDHLLPDSTLGGNIPEANLLKIINEDTPVYVLELSSFQLEYPSESSPNIAVLTNIYVDHLNRYKTFEKYQEVKFNIFKNQTEKDVLVLNLDEAITAEVLAEKPRAKLFFISLSELPKDKNGLYFEKDSVIYQFEGKRTKAAAVKGLAPHEKTNLLTAMLVAHLMGVPGEQIAAEIKDLPNPKFRQEVIVSNKNFTVVNDSAGTSPDATIAAIEKYKGKDLILITGGADKNLDFKDLAKKIAENVKPENLYLLEGSATRKLIKELTKLLYISEVAEYENLEDIIDVISQEYSKGTIVLSPASASFEKFNNEFDRGETFNKLVEKYFGI